MTPIDYLQSLLGVNKTAARFIMSGLGLIAAATIAVGWIGDGANAMTLAFYIMGFAAAVAIVSFVVSNQRMKTALGWMLIVTFGLTLCIAVDSVLQLSGRTPYPVCLRAMLEVPPRTCMQRFADGSTGETVTAAVAPEPSPVEAIIMRGPTITTNGSVARQPPQQQQQQQQADQPAPPVPDQPVIERAPPPPELRVYVHYRRPVTAETARAVSAALDTAGYVIPSGVDGAQQVSAAPSRNTVRYYGAAYADQAETLALDVSEALEGKPVTVQDFSTSGLVAPEYLMEVWISG